VEYIKDRLNHEIRELRRENSMLRESMYHKDRHLMKVQAIYEEAESVNKFLIGALAVTLIVAIGSLLYAVNIMQEVGK
jgi:hypothetical protein